jgi:hypothetical protein
MEAMTMGARIYMGVVLAGVLGASGCSVVVDKELDGKPPTTEFDAGPVDEFCRGRADGTDCSTSDRPDHVCVNFQCVERRCGDGWADEERGEECDRGDGNNTPGSGCEPDCTFTCVDDVDCDDDDICTGGFVCTSTNRCVSDGELLPPNGTVCTIPGSESDGGVGEMGFCCSNMCQADPCG